MTAAQVSATVAEGARLIPHLQEPLFHVGNPNFSLARALFI